MVYNKTVKAVGAATGTSSNQLDMPHNYNNNNLSWNWNVLFDDIGVNKSVLLYIGNANNSAIKPVVK